MGYENDPYRNEDGEPLMDFDKDVPSDREEPPKDLLDDDLDGNDGHDRSPTPVYIDSKSNTQNQLIEKSSGKDSSLVASGLEDDVGGCHGADDDEVAEMVREDYSDGGKRKKDKGEKRKIVEKKSRGDKGEKEFKVRKSGGGRMRDHEADPEMKEMWETVAGDNSKDDQEGVRTVDDENFIDDSGVGPADRYGSDNANSPRRAPQSEEEEDEEIKELFMLAKKKKKNEKSAEEIALLVERVVAELECVAEGDTELNRQGKPAIDKLKKMSLLTDVLSKKQLQQEFLDHGGLTLLKNWLETLKDGSLPNINIRAAVLKVLKKMTDEDAKEGQTSQARTEEEAICLKTMAEEKYASNNLKSALKYAKRAYKLHPSLGGLAEMLASFKIIQTAATSVFPEAPESKSSAAPDYYKILDVERFSHINTIKKKYKKLALTLHPDKNPSAASEEAFKFVGDAARVLSDKIRRKEYDMRLRIAMQSEAEAAAQGELEVEKFWTACSTCRLLHQFEKKYLGHNLICPSCKKSFKAVEVEENLGNANGVEMEDRVEVGATRVSARIQEKVVKGERLGIFEKFGLGVKRKFSTVKEVLERSGANLGKSIGGDDGPVKGSRSKRSEKVASSDGNDDDGTEDFRSLRVGKAKNTNRSKCIGGSESSGRRGGGKVRNGVGIMESERSRRAKAREEETMTLAQMFSKKKKKVGEVKLVMGEEKESETSKEKENEKMEKENDNGEKDEGNGSVDRFEKRYSRRSSKSKNLKTATRTPLEIDRLGASEEDMEIMVVEEEKEKETEKTEKEKEEEMPNTREKRERRRVSKYGNFVVENSERPEDYTYFEMETLESLQKRNLEIMPVEDSDFHDFDKDRRERSFKKGQVWAVYDDDDGMPRHYALIDQVVSVNPFEVTLSWLKFQPYGDEQLLSWKQTGSCGTFRVSRKVSIKYLNLFSHIVDCERAAREVYRIYPKKGTVWALYNDKSSCSEESNKDERRYSIVLPLNSYSDIYGSSIAYLEKVDGFRTVFKRKEIGAHAVVWLGKDDVKLFSHQIPAKKLSGEEALGLPKDCWELDPASLTSQLLIGS